MAQDDSVRERGVNRVVMGVWDLEAGMAFYADLLQTTFTEAVGGEAASFGVRVAINFEAGVELVAPIEGQPSALRTTLETHGEGPIGVVFAVPNADAAKAAAERHGIATTYTLDYDQAMIDQRYDGQFTRFYEHFLEDKAPLRGSTLIGEFDRLR